MMDLDVYEALSGASSHLFKNSLVLPVCVVIAGQTDPGTTISIPEIREGFGGRVESNQIREALKRLLAIRALTHVPSTRRSEPHLWGREQHPIWTFVGEWSRIVEEEVIRAGR